MKNAVLSIFILILGWNVSFGQGVTPKLRINEPSDGLITRQDTVAASGSVFPPAHSTVIEVNGEQLELEPRGRFHTTVELTEGSNLITITARNKPGNTDKVVREVTLDTTLPEITFASPSDSSFTNRQQITVHGSLSEPVSALTLEGEEVTVNSDSTFSETVAIPEGTNRFTLRATDLVGNSSTKDLLVTGDFTSPEASIAVALGDPSDSATEIIEAGHNDTLTINRSSVHLLGEVYDELTEVVVAVNSVTVPTKKMDSLYTFEKQVSLDKGVNSLEVMATDQAGNGITKQIFIENPLRYPYLSINDHYETDKSLFTISGTVIDTSESVSLTIDGQPVPVSQSGAFSKEVSLVPGDNFFLIKAVNADSSEAVQSVRVVQNYDATIPSDPKEVATAVDSTVVTTIQGSTEFLYKGDDPIQRGMADSTIEARRVSVVKGKVLNRSGDPLSGVLITVLNHPEYGYTISREDGQFDMAVNGGGNLIFKYEKEGYLPAQRQVDFPWQDYAVTDDVVMVQLDPNVTTIDFSDSIEVAQGSIESDADGSRQARLMFEQNTKATMVMPDGSTQSLESMNVRATEYTVGENGPAAMPAKLPSTSGYTYAVEFSVDEAIETGASEVIFNKPVASYVDNFLGFPVGTAVPSGYYDRQKGEWIGSEDGRVIEITNISNGAAEVDIDGDGSADPDSTLEVIGIDNNERQKLASLYSPGKTLWRVEVTHFTPWDYNWPFGFPLDAEPPNLTQQEQNINENENSSTKCGSIISVENQTLGEFLDLIGAPCGLYYNSAFTKGFKNRYVLPIKLSETVPASAQKIRLNISIAGQSFDTTFSSRPNLTYDFKWDGKDAYGRNVQGAQKATVHISYVYKAQYYDTREEFSNSFARLGDVPISGGRGVHYISLSQSWNTTLGNFKVTDFGGWRPGIHHRYAMNSGILYKGNGAIREAQSVNNIIDIGIKGSERLGLGNYESSEVTDIASGPDGSMYYGVQFEYSTSGYRIFDYKVIRKYPDGEIETVIDLPASSTSTVAVTGVNGKTEYIELANLRIFRIDVSSEGVIYFSDRSNDRIFKKNSSGELELIAGNGNCGYSGDGDLAVSAKLCDPTDIAVANDGAVYFIDEDRNIVRKIGTDGIISTVAGTGSRGFNRPDGRALEVSLARLRGIDVGPDGNVFITDSGLRVRKITPGGQLVTVAGGQSFSGVWGDGQASTLAEFKDIYDVAVGSDGSLYITDRDAFAIRKVTPEGIIYRLAGQYNKGYLFDTSKPFKGEPARSTLLWLTERIEVSPSGDIYFTEYHINNLRKIDTQSESGDKGEINIPSKDGSQIFVFNAQGKHLKTKDALKGNTIFEFDYNADGKLSKITDIDGLETSIERNSEGKPTSIVSPFGQRTELTIGANGYLSSVQDPEGETVQFSYTGDGLLTEMRDPKNNLKTYQYDSLGYFRRAEYSNGGTKELTKTETKDGYEITLTTAEGNTQKYGVEKTVDGSTIYTNTNASGLKTIRQYGSDGSTIILAPNGVKTVTKQKSDPRFGMQAPLIDKSETIMPSGLKSVLSQERTITQMTGDQVTGITDKITFNGKTSISEYDGNQNLTTSTSPEGRKSYSYSDSLGRVIQSKVPGIELVNYTYNSDGFLTETEQGGRTTEFTYNEKGFLESTTGPLGRTETTLRDSVGRVTKQILSNGEEMDYSYDENGNLISITPPGQPVHTFDYTDVDLTESYLPPTVPDSAGGISYLYDKDKKLLSTTFSDSSSIQMVYDTTHAGSGRPIRINYDQGSTSFAYDSTTGNLTSIASSDSVFTDYSYDCSLTTQIATQLPGQSSGPDTATIDFTYNNDFQMTSQSINGAHTVGFSYDDDGLLVGAGVLSMSYSGQNGLLNSSSVGNITSNYSYNFFGELTGKTAVYSGSDLYNRSFTRDSLGRITRITETIGGQTDTYEYSYNDIGYLVEVKKNGAVTDQYEYDANGNRVKHTTPSDTVTATFDNQDRMLTYGDASYNYGPRGDLQQKIVGTDTTSYNYDNQGNLRSVTLPDGKYIEYLIDGQNRRVAKKVNGQFTKRWLYAEGLIPIAELDSTGNIEKRYGPGYIVKNDTTYRVIKDHLGSVRMVVNSQTGEVVQRIDYDAWGSITHLQDEDEFTDIGFAGGLYDKNTALIRFGARDYDPKIGRWISKDPILFAGGTSNLYEYALNDPINNIDPNGLQSVIDVRDFTAGLTNNVSLGLSGLILDQLGSAGRRDKCSAAYSAGQWAGAIFDVALGGKGLLKSLRKSASNNIAKVSSRAFYSGSGTEATALKEGFETLGQTRAARNLQNLIDNKNIPWEGAGNAEDMWKRLSAVWAKGVPKGSTVNVFLNNPRSNAIWFETELPILLQNNVKIIVR